MQGFWWAENAECSLDYGIGYCFGRFITYRQQYRKTSSGGPSWRERICIRSLRLKLIPICTLLSQPIFVEMAVRQVNGLSGAWVCCVLFFVVDKLGIFRTTLVRRG